MASATATVDIPGDPDKVWELIGGFGSLPDWLPYIPSSELGHGGRTRTLKNPDGETIIERLVAFDSTTRSYTYTFIQTSFPVTDYLSTLQVLPIADGTRSRVCWTGTFTERGVSKSKAVQIFQRIYDDGLAALAAHFNAGARGTRVAESL